MKRSNLTIERVFSDEGFANEYAKKHKKMVDKFGQDYSLQLKSRGFEKGRIIDVGCGSGGTAIALAKNLPDSEVFGIDLSRPLLRIANQTAHTAAGVKRLTFEMADVHNIPYDDHYFDVVLNINMVHLVEDPVQMLNEMERILVPNGFLFIADLRRSRLGLIEKEIKSALTLQEARELFSRSEVREGIFSSSILWWRYRSR